MVFDAFDVKTAQQMLGDSEHFGGIPAYLGIRITDAGPGTLTAELDVRPELLNPFGTAHGGTLAAVADHLLGSVLYPVIPVVHGRPPRSST